MSCIQFAVCGVLSGIPALLLENPRISSLLAAWVPVLYAGVLSCGVAYTLQIIGQKGMNPTVASLILSLESCISVLAGWIILGQRLSGREIAGCVIMLPPLCWPSFRAETVRTYNAQNPWPPSPQSGVPFYSYDDLSDLAFVLKMLFDPFKALRTDIMFHLAGVRSGNVRRYSQSLQHLRENCVTLIDPVGDLRAFLKESHCSVPVHGIYPSSLNSFIAWLTLGLDTPSLAAISTERTPPPFWDSTRIDSR